MFRRAKERKKRHDFPTSNPSGSTESGAASPFFDRSSSSDHKVTDESDCEEFVTEKQPNNFLNASLDTILQSKTKVTDDSQPTNRRKKRPLNELEEESPVKRVRPSVL
jgi:hypothetical protein